jgi:hypothetical protein
MTAAAVTNSPAPIVVLLTATVDGRGVAFMERRDPKIRLNDYKAALRAWLSNPATPPLIFAENSGYPTEDLDEVVRTANRHGHAVEVLSFDDNNYQRSLGKGFGELRTIRYALDHSRLIGDETFVIKVTGRHYVRNVSDLAACSRAAGEVDVFCDLRGNLTWADTRVFCATTRFIREFFLPMEHAVDDTAGVTIEHVLGRAAHLAMSRGRRWSMFPRAPQIRGVSGTSDATYPDSFLAHYKRELFRTVKTAVLAR